MMRIERFLEELRKLLPTVRAMCPESVLGAEFEQTLRGTIFYPLQAWFCRRFSAPVIFRSIVRDIYIQYKSEDYPKKKSRHIHNCYITDTQEILKCFQMPDTLVRKRSAKLQEYERMFKSDPRSASEGTREK